MAIMPMLKQALGPLVSVLQGSGADRPYTPTPLRAMEAITQRESFASILPFTAYSEAEGLFVLDTGDRDPKGKREALGFALEVSPQTGATPEMIQILTAIMSGAPSDAKIQISLFGSGRVIEKFKAAAMLRHGSPDDGNTPGEQRSQSVFRTMARRRTEFLLRGTRERLVPHLPFLVRDLRVVLSLALPCDPRDPAAIEELHRQRQAIHATLKAASFVSWDWSPSDLINWCSDILNPQQLFAKGQGMRLAYDPGRLLRHQIIRPDTICRPCDDGVSLMYGRPGSASEVHSRLYTVTSYPDEYPLWAMGNIIGDFYEGQLGYPCPFVVTMGVHILDKASNKALAQVKGARATTNMESPMARFMPEFKTQKRAWDVVNKAYGENLGEVQMYHQVLLMAPPGEIESAERSAQSIWRRRGFGLAGQQFMQVPGVLGSLPLGFTPTIHKFYQRVGLLSRKTTKNAINLAPLLGEWKGTATPVMQLLGRRGQVMGLDIFDNKGGNYNFAVAASSGSGKSVLANELATGYLGSGAKVFIIDVGRSYEKICSLIGGEFIEFVDREDGQICINPFDRIDNLAEDMEILKPLVGQMISPSGTLSDEDRSFIEIAISDAWKRLGKTMTISDVAHELAAIEDPVATRLSRQLFPYTRDGMYGRYFDGPSNVDFGNDFVVLELEELKAKKDLQSVVLFIMMFRITQAMYLERSRKKICIIDEAWDLLSGGNSAKFIEEGYRRARKYGGAFGTLTQSVGDYYKNPASQACLDNADWLFLLKQKKESLEQLARSGRLSLDDGLKRILASVRTEEGLYSEIFISSPAGQGVGRLVVDPYSLLVYSSTPSDWRAIERHRASGLSVAQAIDAVLAERSGVAQQEAA